MTVIEEIAATAKEIRRIASMKLPDIFPSQKVRTKAGFVLRVLYIERKPISGGSFLPDARWEYRGGQAWCEDSKGRCSWEYIADLRPDSDS